jgi:hypothetical protein
MPANPPGPMFQIRGVTKTYRLGHVDVRALRGVDLVSLWLSSVRIWDASKGTTQTAAVLFKMNSGVRSKRQTPENAHRAWAAKRLSCRKLTLDRLRG